MTNQHPPHVSGTIKALEWVLTSYTTTDDDNGPREGVPRKLNAWKADRYLIIKQDSVNGLFILKGVEGSVNLATPYLKTAQAAAQADYNARILAAIQPDPQPERLTDEQVKSLVNGWKNRARRALAECQPDPQPVASGADMVEVLSAAEFLRDPTGQIECGTVASEPVVVPEIATVSDEACDKIMRDLNIATPSSAPASVAEAARKRIEKALNDIQELNMSGADENGHRWANSDLIDQTVMEGLSALRALSEESK